MSREMEQQLVSNALCLGMCIVGSSGELLGLGNGLATPLNLRQSIIVAFFGFVLSNTLLVVTVATLDEIQIFKGNLVF